jgi:hypothetical protein
LRKTKKLFLLASTSQGVFFTGLNVGRFRPVKVTGLNVAGLNVTGLNVGYPYVLRESVERQNPHPSAGMLFSIHLNPFPDLC